MERDAETVLPNETGSGQLRQQQYFRHDVLFRGETGEYFGIWIVNVLLTVLTLGIYSAWAKVRTRRYFYGNIEIDGATFDYHARPVQILIGRVIVVAFLIGIQLVSAFFPLAAPLLFIPIGIAVPFLVVRATRFNARMTSYRLVRFDFDGTYWHAAMAFVIWPLTIIPTLGLTLPLLTRSVNQFLGNGHRYGDRPFSLNMPLKPLYKLYFTLYGIVYLIALLTVGAAFLVFLNAAANPEAASNIAVAGAVLIQLAPFTLIILLALLAIAYRAGTRNLGYAHLVLDGRHRFHSELSKRRYTWIVATNTLATVFSFGLLRPWASIRLARYTAACTSVHALGALDDFVSSVTESAGVISGEYFDVEGIDIGGAI